MFLRWILTLATVVSNNSAISFCVSQTFSCSKRTSTRVLPSSARYKIICGCWLSFFIILNVKIGGAGGISAKGRVRPSAQNPRNLAVYTLSAAPAPTGLRHPSTRDKRAHTSLVKIVIWRRGRDFPPKDGCVLRRRTLETLRFTRFLPRPPLRGCGIPLRGTSVRTHL